ncbi:MAG: hypothetical protein QG657_2255 [Acidobacteriota bacterium]|nr:hypothetical protein [Acidobacteriota bacterium]
MNWREIFSNGIFIFLGIIAGTAVNALTQVFFARKNRKKQLRNLKFEIEMNIKKIDKWLEGINEYRNAVNSDALNVFYTYFDFSKFITVTAVSMFQNGTLYNYLDHEDIGDLQVIFNDFSLVGENIINNQIIQNKSNFNKTTAISNVNYWEKTIKSHKVKLREILSRLPK